MPNFELHIFSPPKKLTIRARDEIDAVRRSSLPEDEYTIVVEEDYHGWREVLHEYKPVAKVRSHQRMKFRRD